MLGCGSPKFCFNNKRDSPLNRDHTNATKNSRFHRQIPTLLCSLSKPTTSRGLCKRCDIIVSHISQAIIKYEQIERIFFVCVRLFVNQMCRTWCRWSTICWFMYETVRNLINKTVSSTQHPDPERMKRLAGSVCLTPYGHTRLRVAYERVRWTMQFVYGRFQSCVTMLMGCATIVA